MFRAIILYSIIATQLYLTVLVGGGRGPFGLYDSFWSCHCSDPVENTIADPFRPTLLGSGTLKTGDGFEVDEDMCLSPATRKALNLPDICPKKMPLRYLTLLMEGSHVFFHTLNSELPEVSYTCLYRVFQNQGDPRSGFPFQEPIPPRV